MIERKGPVLSPLGKWTIFLNIRTGTLWFGLLLVGKIHAGGRGCENRWEKLPDPLEEQIPWSGVCHCVCSVKYKSMAGRVGESRVYRPSCHFSIIAFHSSLFADRMSFESIPKASFAASKWSID